MNQDDPSLLDPRSSEAADLAATRFDAAWYLRAYQDIGAAGIDPWQHYLHTGWREGRNPGPDFDSAFYLASNPDVVEAGCNPFVHYCLLGEDEGRLPQQPMNPAQARLREVRPLAERARDWRRELPAPLAATDLWASLTALAPASWVIALSHDDYRQNTGGLQNCVGDEEAAFTAAGWGYLHASPAQPLPLLAAPGEASDFLVMLALNGESLGCFRMSDLIATARRLAGRAWLVVHHLLGFAPEHVAPLAEALGEGRAFLWLHDFFQLCPNFTLLRNDVAFCHAPPRQSAGCAVCVYGEERHSHLRRMEALFAAMRPRLLAPSATPLALFRERAGHWPHQDAQVVPLARLLLRRPVPARPVGRALRVAHLGGDGWHKGWPVFAALAARHAQDPRYEFVQLGWPRPARLPRHIRHVPVQVGPGNRKAMIEAVAAAGVDVALIWPAVQETFSFVTHEAVAGGAFVVTCVSAGNVGPAVTAPDIDQGLALPDTAALEQLFAAGDLGQRLAARRHGALLLGRITADVLLTERIFERV